MKRKNIKILTPDQVQLVAVIEEPETQPKAVAILAHGITVEKNEGGFYTGLSRHLVTDQIATVRFDFRGHGESGGRSEEMTVVGEIIDLATVIKFSLKRYQLPLGVVATSFGASIALLYGSCEKRFVKTQVLLCPVVDYSKAFLNPETPWGRKQFGQRRIELAKRKGFISVDGFRLGIKLFTEFGFYKPGEVLNESGIPTLLVHGTDDSMVPFGPSKRYAQRAKNCRFLPIRGADHGFEGYEGRVYEETRSWLSQHLAD